MHSKTRDDLELVLPGYEPDEPKGKVTKAKDQTAEVPRSSEELKIEGLSKKKPKPTAAQAKRAEAVKRHNQGHLVSPLGQQDMRLRKFDWKRAKDIGPEGGVTAAQLWRHLYIKYEDAFGPGILEAQMPQDRYAISAWFDKLRSKFMKTCGYRPDYRELSEYFTWILDPERLRRAMNIGRLTNSRTYLKIEQIEGGIYMRNFFDTNIVPKGHVELNTANRGVKKWQMIMKEVLEIFDALSEAGDSQFSQMLCLARYGFPLVLQFYAERLGLSEGQGRKRIIQLMANFVQGSDDFDGAVKFLDKIMESTEAYDSYYTDAVIWKDYKTKCKDLIGEATEMAKNGKQET